MGQHALELELVALWEPNNSGNEDYATQIGSGWNDDKGTAWRPAVYKRPLGGQGLVFDVVQLPRSRVRLLGISTASGLVERPSGSS